jgi:hypothetical protein
VAHINPYAESILRRIKAGERMPMDHPRTRKILYQLEGNLVVRESGDLWRLTEDGEAFLAARDRVPASTG